MTGWNEDNFIERIIPLLKRRFGAAPCPEAAAFLAASNGETSGVLRKAMAEHASGCPDCRDLQQRMERFDAPMVTGHDAEWQQTEKRLDNWLESFLASDATAHRERDRVRPSHLRLCWTKLTSQSVVRQLRWVLIPAVTLALVICSFLAGRGSVRRSAPLTAEVKGLPATMIPPQTVAAQRASEREPTGESQVSRTPQTPPKPAEGRAIARRRISPSPGFSTAPEDSVRPTETAVLAPPVSSNSETAPISSPAEPLRASPGNSAPTLPSARGDRSVQIAEASGLAPSIRPAVPGVLPSRQAVPSGMTALTISRGVPPVPETRVAPPPAIPAPVVITLDAGTRVWIALRSIRTRADGVSEFRGVLLLPVTQSGATLLGRNTQVSGTVTARDGKRSVQILEFLSAGAHYRLRGASGEANLRLLGAGQALEFDAGKVLETWMASASTYEKVPGEPRPPE
jgi:hypothetical protein